MISKLSREQYQHFIEDFYNNRHQHERLGQAFMNAYKIPNEFEVRNLFYVEDEEIALNIIEEHYVVPDDLEMAS